MPPPASWRPSLHFIRRPAARLVPPICVRSSVYGKPAFLAMGSATIFYVSDAATAHAQTPGGTRTGRGLSLLGERAYRPTRESLLPLSGRRRAGAVPA